MRAMTWSAVELEGTRNCLETEKRLLMKTNEELRVCFSHTNTNGGRITDKLLKDILQIYL